MRQDYPGVTESQLQDDVAYGNNHDLWQDPYGQALLVAYGCGVRDPVVVGDIHQRAERGRTREALGETVPFRLPQLHRGEIQLGSSTANRSIGILLAWLNAGLLICGNTGATKSNLIKYLIQQAASLLRVWVSDMYKREMRHLRALLQPAVDFIVLRPADLRINLLQADGDPRAHLPMVLDILRRILDLPGRAMAILKGVCHQLYVAFGVYVGIPQQWPTLFDVYERVRAAPDLNAAAREAIMDRLGSFLMALTPGVGAYRQAWRVSDLTRHHIVFEMRGTSEHVKSAVLSYLLFSVLYSRIEQSVANAPLDLVVAFEDAQRFFGERAADSEMTPVEEVAGLIRGTGVSLWCSCQSMAGLSRGLIPNLATKVMGRLGSHQDYQQLGADMGMDPEQIAWAKTNLQPGRFVCQLAEGPWRLPFVANVPRVIMPPVVGDAEATASVKALAALPTAPATEFADWQPHQVIELPATEESAQARPPGLSEMDIRFLQVVVDHPGEKFSALARLAGMSGKRAAEIRQRLVELGYVREHAVATGGRGRHALVLEPLPPTLEACGRFVT